MKDAIERLKCNTSAGSDGVTAEFYNQLFEILVPFLLSFFLFLFIWQKNNVVNTLNSSRITQ